MKQRRTVGLIAVIILLLTAMTLQAEEEERDPGVAAMQRGDYDQAEKIFLALAAQDNAVAKYNLALLYGNKSTGKLDIELALQWLERSAESGFSQAQFLMGKAYEDGEVVSKDIKKAIYWFQKAGEQNHNQALSRLHFWWNAAHDYFGYENYSRALLVFEAFAQYKVAGDLWVGHTNYKLENWGEAAKSFKVAAEYGETGAMYMLGSMSRDGRGMTKNREQAMSWYLKAAEQGHSSAQQELARMYYLTDIADEWNPKEAAKWYLKAAQQGHNLAQFDLAVLYRKGDGVEQSNEDYVFWNVKAAQSGLQVAEERLRKHARYVPYELWSIGIPEPNTKIYQKPDEESRVTAYAFPRDKWFRLDQIDEWLLVYSPAANDTKELLMGFVKADTVGDPSPPKEGSPSSMFGF